jgi:predicted XRE-type DNA-binding protein
MSDDDFEIVEGSGNIFRDFNHPNADLEQLRSILAARIIKLLDERQLTVRKAGEITGIAAADFSRIRRVKLDRFTVDRLMTILNRLGQEVEIDVNFRPRQPQGMHPAPAR